MKRRDFLHFLHGASWTTIFWGLGQEDQAQAISLSDSFSVGSPYRYWQTVAAPTARKFALLVGLNNYADVSFSPLTGCLTDLELQRQLLCHHYGFADKDILILADQQATGSNYQGAMTEHLINQVQPGDVVMCHFSGYGTQVNGEAALVLFDRVLPLAQLDIWLRSLPTPYITTILDTSFISSPESPFSNFSSRSLPKMLPSPVKPNLITSNKLAINQQIIPPDQDIIPSLPGVVIRANVPGQVALERPWDGFSAGLFTYAFTQKLWQTGSTTIKTNVEQISKSLKTFDIPTQEPVLGGRANTPPFFLPLEQLSTAHGLVREVVDNTATLWLGGVPTQVLTQYGLESLLVPILPLNADATVPNRLLLQIIERSGLQAKAKIISSADTANSPLKSPLELPKAGTLLQELVRVLPQQIPLQIAFDRQLTRVERVDATSAFANIGEISLGKDPADYLFTNREGSYGLSTLGGDLLPTTQGQAGEAVKSAVSRLKQQLHSLLAIKLLYLTDNGAINTIDDDNAESQRIAQPQVRITRDVRNLQQYFLENGSNLPLYGLAFCSTSEQELWVLGSSSEQGLTAYQLLPHSTISVTIPEKLINADNTNDYPIYGIFSTHPLSQTLAILMKTRPADSKSPSTLLKLSQPLPVIKALYQDLQTPNPAVFPVSANNSYVLDVNTWVTFWF